MYTFLIPSSDDNAFTFTGGKYPDRLDIGRFVWSAENFSHNASDIDLQMEGPTHEPILHAQLSDDSGSMRTDKVNLADCIKNEDGHLCFMDCF